MATKDKPNNKNLRALFSVICLCIVALGLIVYFSTQSSHTTDVNEATTVVEKAKEKKVTTTNNTQLTTDVYKRQTIHSSEVPLYQGNRFAIKSLPFACLPGDFLFCQ